MSDPAASVWRRPLPLRQRVGLVAAALLLGLVACSGGVAADLAAVDAAGEDAPRLERLEVVAFDAWGFPAPRSADGLDPAGGQFVRLHGANLSQVQVVWLGADVLVYEDRVQVAPDGASLVFVTPPTEPGAELDVGVGAVDAWSGEVLQRSVLPGAFATRGLSPFAVTVICLVIAGLALLGTPLYAVIAAITCLGLYLETQLNPNLGFFTSHDPHAVAGKQGTGTNLFTSWLSPMGDTPLFIAIPLFTFAGTLMSESRAPTRLINLARAFIGWLPGGLALVTLVTCCFFTAFTGASGVTIIALGGLLFPILLRERYPERFSLGLLTTGGSLGLLFPPSLPVIVYGLVTHLDVKRLFQATLIPGILLVLFLAVTSYVVAVKERVPRHRFTLRDVGAALRGALWELPLPLVVVGGIYLGFVNAAEASAVTALYVLVTTVGIYRDLRPRDLPGVVRRSAVLVGAILLIMGTALGFSDWLSLVRIPQKILGAMQDHIHDQLTFLVMLNVFLLIVGCLMDIFSATLVVVPLIAPVALEFGIDPYHLAAIFLVNLEIGYSTPPVGINLFIASLRFRRPVFALYRASLLFIGVLLLALLLITYVPFLSLGLFDRLPEVSLPAGPVTVKQYEDRELRPERVSLGDLTVEKAREQLQAATEALREAEEELGASWPALDRAVKDARQAVESAQGDAARDELRAALEARRPLESLAQEVDVRRRALLALEDMIRKTRWRSRLDGTERTGEAFSTADLAPGRHVLTATVTDDKGHVAQARIEVVVEPVADGEEGGDDAWGSDEDWGDEGAWDEGAWDEEPDPAGEGDDDGR